MDPVEKIEQARKKLSLGRNASLADIKTNYRRLIMENHPDRCPSPQKEAAAETSAELNRAYKTLLHYCEQFEFDFSEQEIRKNLPPEQMLYRRFSDDPVWGKWRNDERNRS